MESHERRERGGGERGEFISLEERALLSTLTQRAAAPLNSTPHPHHPLFFVWAGMQRKHKLNYTASSPSVYKMLFLTLLILFFSTLYNR